MGVKSNFVQWRGQVKKDLAAMSMGRDEAVRKLLSLIVTEVRQDGFISSAGAYNPHRKQYNPFPGATIPRRRGGGNIYHHSKFVNRTGDLKRGFADLRWTGNTASNGTDLRAEVTGSGKGELEVIGYSERILRYHPVNRKTVHVIGTGSASRSARSDRGIVQRASRKVSRGWAVMTKKAIDAGFRKAGGGIR
jgi:hypothetical protein